MILLNESQPLEEASPKPVKVPFFYQQLLNRYGIVGLNLKGIGTVDGFSLKGEFAIAAKNGNQFLVLQKKHPIDHFTMSEIDSIFLTQTSRGQHLLINCNPSSGRKDIHLEGIIQDPNFKI